MSLSMHQASVPVFVRMLNNLSAILKTAEAHAEAKKIEPSVLINDRLAPDMLPLSRQIQIATDGAKGCVARLAGIEVPSYPDTEATFAELQERLAKTIAFLNSVPADKIDGSEDRTITLKVGGKDLNFPGSAFLLNFATPNFYFHVTATYLILRHNGVQLGKMDYLGAA
ncbi:DUF1993 domain-containing protein [Phenylobacterium hankyongense]|uniref:DUF1993 domain-containing protein n=1 Tax=Phenylobacterium hankyongense TaxID=1813876 RepID=A0A328AZ14_9CAUL|nr:DUF1993 domain-containing protein [Phenylobacterium hankyongense]RAK60163.1 DUF1993 domain-containing protein [Phenylobacterium hankyongense]